MFCPKCKSEYREGFYKCADCGADLVTEQPTELVEEISYVDLVEVYSTYQQSDIAFIKSVFDGEGITYFFEGESSIMLVAGGAYARLLVKAEEVQRAKEILREVGFLE
jgi:DNA-directed RNA polymerase subunit RPC12/RpoP